VLLISLAAEDEIIQSVQCEADGVMYKTFDQSYIAGELNQYFKPVEEQRELSLIRSSHRISQYLKQAIPVGS
jgi:hypothetical protein